MAASSSSSAAAFFGVREEDQIQMMRQQQQQQQHSSSAPPPPPSSSAPPQKKRRNQPGTPSKYQPILSETKKKKKKFLFIPWVCVFVCWFLISWGNPNFESLNQELIGVFTKSPFQTNFWILANYLEILMSTIPYHIRYTNCIANSYICLFLSHEKILIVKVERGIQTEMGSFQKVSKRNWHRFLFSFFFFQIPF